MCRWHVHMACAYGIYLLGHPSHLLHLLLGGCALCRLIDELALHLHTRVRARAWVRVWARVRARARARARVWARARARVRVEG